MNHTCPVQLLTHMQTDRLAHDEAYVPVQYNSYAFNIGIKKKRSRTQHLGMQENFLARYTEYNAHPCFSHLKIQKMVRVICGNIW